MRVVVVPGEAAPSPRPRRRFNGRTAVGGVDPLIAITANRYDIDPAFLRALVRAESGGDPAAVSPKGARGLMQVTPSTARRFGVGARALGDPALNLAVGASYLKALQRRYGNNLPLVLAAYNAGEGAVDRHGHRIPPFRETTGYVVRVLANYQDNLRDQSIP